MMEEPNNLVWHPNGFWVINPNFPIPEFNLIAIREEVDNEQVE